jgi:hypothetical protein
MKALLGAVLAALVTPALALAQLSAPPEPPPVEEPPQQAAPTAEAQPVDPTSPPSVPPANPTPPPPAAVTQLTPEQEKLETGWSFGLDLDHSVGQGTFYGAEQWAAVDGSVLFSPSYKFNAKGVKLNATGRVGLGWEYTRPDSANARRVSWSDFRASLSAPAVWTEKHTGIAFTPSVSATLPISMESRRATVITVLGATAGLSRTFGKFDLGYRLGFTRGFHANPAIASAPGVTGADNLPLCISRPGEGICNVDGINTMFSISNSFEVTFRATEKLSFAIAYGIANRFKYPMPQDEHTPKTRDVNGEPVAQGGLGRRDAMTSSISASYVLSDRFSLSAGIATPPLGVDPMYGDLKGFRFPFFEFLYPGSNVTSFSLTFSAML